jgi:hypothetical protein
MVHFNKGGRPQKPGGEKMKYKVSVKMSTLEYYTLKSKAKEAGITRSEFIRGSIMNTTVVQRVTPELNAEIRKLSGISNPVKTTATGAERYARKLPESTTCILPKEKKM